MIRKMLMASALVLGTVWAVGSAQADQGGYGNPRFHGGPRQQVYRGGPNRRHHHYYRPYVGPPRGYLPPVYYPRRYGYYAPYFVPQPSYGFYYSSPGFGGSLYFGF